MWRLREALIAVTMGVVACSAFGASDDEKAAPIPSDGGTIDGAGVGPGQEGGAVLDALAPSDETSTNVPATCGPPVPVPSACETIPGGEGECETFSAQDPPPFEKVGNVVPARDLDYVSAPASRRIFVPASAGYLFFIRGSASRRMRGIGQALDFKISKLGSRIEVMKVGVSDQSANSVLAKLSVSTDGTLEASLNGRPPAALSGLPRVCLMQWVRVQMQFPDLAKDKPTRLEVRYGGQMATIAFTSSVEVAVYDGNPGWYVGLSPEPNQGDAEILIDNWTAYVLP